MCVCAPIFSPIAELPLITFVTTRGPTPPPASTTKVIFSLATAMTHFLPHYKATSLACSQMVSRGGLEGSDWLLAHSELNNSASNLLRIWLAPEQLATNYYTTLSKSGGLMGSVLYVTDGMHVSFHNCSLN